MKKILLSALIALPMTVMAGETYKIFSVNQATNFFEGSSSESNTPLGETGPGPTTFEGGDEQAGFYGEVPVSELFSGDELASKIGLTAGTAQHSNAPWLKFAYKGKLLYVAQKPFRYEISWVDINSVGAVKEQQNTTVSKEGNTYLVTLMRCDSTSPSYWDDNHHSFYDPETSEGSEWNNLIYRVHSTQPDSQLNKNWFSYSNNQLIIGTGNGRATWCQEESEWDNSHTRYVNRGHLSLSYFKPRPESYDYQAYGWRPVLRLE